MMKKRIAPFLLLGIGFIVFAVAIKAQSTQPGLTVHPTNFDLNLNPGQTSEGVIYLKNNTKNTVNIKTSLRNFTAEGEEGGVDLTTQNTPFSLASWIKVTPESAKIGPNEEAVFHYTITPPANAEPGGHFGSVVFATIPSKNNTGAAGSQVSQEIASLFLATIPGPVVENASIVSFKADKPFYPQGPVNFDMRVKNEGGVHIRPAGVITIKSMWGSKNVVGFQGENVLPGAIRKMTATWDSNWMIGKYSAVLALAYGSKNSQIYADTEFWTFPVIPAIIVLVVLIFLFFFRKRIWKATKVIVRGK